MKRPMVLALLLALTAAACSSAAEVVVEQLAESDEDISNVEINDGEITVEFEDDEGGGALVIGGGDIPDGLPVAIPDGGEVASSLSQGDSYAVIVNYSESDYDQLVTFYEEWIAGESVEDLFTNTFDSPKSRAWGGSIGNAEFSINVLEAPDGEGNPSTMVMVNWEG